jgi:hypothetical protein
MRGECDCGRFLEKVTEEINRIELEVISVPYSVG